MADKEENTGRRMMIGGAARALGMVVRMVVGFFMLPFLVGQLGTYWYGVYFATVGLVANFYLLDFGLATATMRQTAVGLARRDDDAVNRVINTTLRIYTGLGGVVLLCTLALVALAPVVTDTTEVDTVRIVLLIVGTNLALSFPTKCLAGLVMGMLRYDLLLVLDMATFLLGVGATIIALTNGYGVVSLAVITLVTDRLYGVMYVVLAKRLFPGLRFIPRGFDWSSGKSLASYSVWSFLIMLANQLRFRVDSLTTGALFGGDAITRYSIGGRLVEYAQQPLALVSNTAMPALARLHATDERDKMSAVVLFLLRLHLVVAIFAAGLVMFLGRPFIETWMGPEFGPSNQIASILAVGFMTELFLTPLINSLLASAKHRMLAIANIVEAFCNLALSIILGKMFGLVGIALGTTIPLLVMQLFWVAPYAARELNIGRGPLILLALPGALAIVVFGVLSLLLESVVWQQGYLGVVAGGAIITVIYWPIVLFACLTREDRDRLWRALPGRA
jgi:O-antigen/teichoic acid export membrane protein